VSLIDQAALRPERAFLRRPSPRPLFDLRPTEIILAEGGDARLLQGKDGRNRYGCGTRPESGIADFGSSTASTISLPAFGAAEALRRRLSADLADEASAAIYAREMQRIRDELLELLGIEDMGPAVIFGASGSDLHLFASRLCAGSGEDALAIVSIEPEETGGFVPAALAGRHFTTRTALGLSVALGAPLSGRASELVAVASRDDDGTPRSGGAVEAEMEAAIRKAIGAGGRALLVMSDVSKTGLLAPSPGFARELAGTLAGRLDVLVDACQFRLAPATLRAYLDAGFMVALTGSKFLTGPAFSGALLVPPGMARRFASCDLANELSAYAAQAEWPVTWANSCRLPQRANLGLLLRWEAALTELRAFLAVPSQRIKELLAHFAAAISARLAADPAFEPLPVPAIERTGFGEADAWDRLPTIFPFVLRARGRYLDPEEVASLHLLLPRDARGLIETGAATALRQAAQMRFRLGQPVRCGRRGGQAMAALRLCASARLVAEASRGEAARDAVIGRALAGLDKAALLAPLVAAGC
jgi:hypothetical protein